MTTGPILSVVTFLPCRRAAIYISRGDDEARGATRAGSPLWTNG